MQFCKRIGFKIEKLRGWLLEREAFELTKRYSKNELKN